MMRFSFLHARACALLFFAAILTVSGCGRESAPAPDHSEAERTLYAETPVYPYEFSVLASDAAKEPKWVRATHLTVEGDSNRSADVRVLMKAGSHAGKLKCAFKTEDARFENEKNKWFPLPVWLVRPKNEDKPLDPAFSESLTFPKEDKFWDASGVEFKTVFTRGAYSFQALWKLKPVETGAGAEMRCSAVAELCAKIQFSDEKARTVCLGDWKWIFQLVAVPNVYNWLRGDPNDVSRLRAEYVDIKDGKYQPQKIDY